MNWKKIIGFWILGVVLIIGIFWLGREAYYYKNPVILFGIGKPVEPNTDRYVEQCGIHGMRRSRLGMDKKLAAIQLRAHDALLELTLRIKEKYSAPKKANLKLEFLFENNTTTVTYRGLAEDDAGNMVPVEESVQFDGILTTKINDGSGNQSFGVQKWQSALYYGGQVVCAALWLGALVLIFRKKR